MEAVCEVVDLKLEAKVVEEDDGSVLLLSLLLDYYYYHYNILLRFLYFGEEEMATQQPPGVEAAKTASVFDVLLLRRFLFSAFGRRWPRAPTFYSENFCPTRLPHRYQF